MKKLIFSFILAITLLGCTKEKQTNRAAVKMQDFVVDIAQYARSFDSDFIIVPQNGVELAFLDLDPNEGEHPAYLLAVNGFGVEELFYRGGFSPDYERLALLRKLQKSRKILVSEYVGNDDDIADALHRNYSEGFICFPRSSDNYNYLKIPDTIPYPNSVDILTLSQAQNYLYFINTEFFLSRGGVIDAIARTDFDLIIMDLFFNETEWTAEEINQLKRKANGGQRIVLSYINIGAAEKCRYYWQGDWYQHLPSWMKKEYEGYHDEYWVEFWEPEWQKIIYGNDNSYIKKIIDAGFDGAYLDNVEGYYFLYHDE